MPTVARASVRGAFLPLAMLTLAMLPLTAIPGPVAAAPAPADSQRIIEDIKTLVRIPTYREDDLSNEDEVTRNLQAIEDIFHAKAEVFNGTVRHHKIRPFEWKAAAGSAKPYWVFGFRAGDGPRKTSIITHLDTVAPGNLDWRPFEPREETRTYDGAAAPFLVGRGAIDDKGPAVVALDVLMRALKDADDNPDALAGVTLEVLFDTSEETDMSTPFYFEAVPDAKPALGIVFDAFWCVRAEKGLERVSFAVAPDGVAAPPPGALAIADLHSAPGPVNMIPASASARITGEAEALNTFADNVDDWYRTTVFDDATYRPAILSVTRDGDAVVLTTRVAGAQHGSAPDENRAQGANPVVSLTFFLASLIDRGALANNSVGEVARFARWAFGTRVFGEGHPELLQRSDTVFQEGNGTTYALTQLIPADAGMTLAIDIRYATGHHATPWDGSEGVMKGNSAFTGIFADLVRQYREAGGASVAFTTRTVVGPDIRDPGNAYLSQVNAAYLSVMGKACPMYAIGGATDAKDHPELVAAGALFGRSMGPPVNFHGLDEGAPVDDLMNSAEIVLTLLRQAIGRH
jgi:succinyl-diaminopimelate desuccinylase